MDVPYSRLNAPIGFYKQQKTGKGVVGEIGTIVKWTIVRKIVRKKTAAYDSVLLWYQVSPVCQNIFVHMNTIQ
jgi:hypothetical protein